MPDMETAKAGIAAMVGQAYDEIMGVPPNERMEAVEDQLAKAYQMGATRVVVERLPATQAQVDQRARDMGLTHVRNE